MSEVASYRGSGLTFLAGGLLAYGLSRQMDLSWLIPSAAGNFLYIGASDLIPEINRHNDIGANALHFAAFVPGLALLLLARLTIEP